MRTTSDLMIDRLLHWGVDTYFGLHVRDEEESALTAVGYARISGRPISNNLGVVRQQLEELR